MIHLSNHKVTRSCLVKINQEADISA